MIILKIHSIVYISHSIFNLVYDTKVKLVKKRNIVLLERKLDLCVIYKIKNPSGLKKRIHVHSQSKVIQLK